jgi:hypothetical protein
VVLWDFAFGDVADGVPTMPEDTASGQIQIVTNDGDQDFLFGLNNSAIVAADGSVIPEPTTALLLGIGLGGLALHQGRRRAEPTHSLR